MAKPFAAGLVVGHGAARISVLWSGRRRCAILWADVIGEVGRELYRGPVDVDVTMRPVGAYR